MSMLLVCLQFELLSLMTHLTIAIMSLTTNSHSETDHLFKKREISVSSMSFNTSENDVQQNKQLQSSTDNSNLTVRLSNQSQFTEVTLDSDTLK